jgi:hypothetical protein
VRTREKDEGKERDTKRASIEQREREESRSREEKT